MITNEYTNEQWLECWLQLTDRQRAQVITKFKLSDPERDLLRPDVKNYLRRYFIKPKSEVITK